MSMIVLEFDDKIFALGNNFVIDLEESQYSGGGWQLSLNVKSAVYRESGTEEEMRTRYDALKKQLINNVR